MKKLLLLLVIIISSSLLSSCTQGTESLPDISLFSEKYRPDGVSVITDMNLSGTELFISDSSQILIYDVSSGEAFQFCSDDNDMIYADEKQVYAYSNDSNLLKIWSRQSELIHEMNLTEVIPSGLSRDITVTDNYIIIFGHGYLFKIDKKSYENIMIEISLNFYNITHCYGDIVGLSFQGSSSLDNYIQRYDLRNDKEIDRVYTNVYSSEIAYNKKDSFFYVVEFASLLDVKYVKKVEESNLGLSLVKVAQTKMDAETDIKNLNTMNNIVLWSDSEEENAVIHMKYIDDSSDSLVICTESMLDSTLEYICNIFSAKYGIDVQIKQYDEFGKIKLKLMANDNDFDLCIPVYNDADKYVKAGIYENLFNYSEINEAIQPEIELITFLAVNDNKMFAVPFNIITRDKEKSTKSPSWKSDTQRQRKEKNVMTYLFSALDLAEGVYTDESGEELKRMLEFALSDQNNDTAGTYIEEADYLRCSYIYMNPFSKNKDIAALFLSEYIDLLSGKTEIDINADEEIRELLSRQWNLYSECKGVDYTSMYPLYKSITSDPYLIIGDAYSSVTSGNISVESAVKEAVSKLKTIVYE